MRSLRGFVMVVATASLCFSCSGDTGPTGAAGVDGIAGVNGGDGVDGQNGTDGKDGVALTGYVGSETCGGCHSERHAGWINSAHPYKIVPKDEILDGTAYPAFVQATRGESYAIDDDFFSDQASLMSINADTFPNGGWDDVSYVIGGYGWKARFINTQGYIITGTDKGNADAADDDKVQFNFPINHDAVGQGAYGPKDATSATYHTGELKPYNCGGCHTTGWVPDMDAATDNDLTDNQDGLPGIHGTWSEPGVGCEACHGPGAAHASQPYDIQTSADPDATCEGCHVRSYLYEIDTKGGYIKHHEQSEELAQGKHAAIGCTGCHDSHQPTKYESEYVALDGTADDPNPDFTNRRGTRVTCESCHILEALAYDDWARDYGAMDTVTCEGCHMPKTGKSGHAVGTFMGDVSGHLFGINPGADFIADPSLSTTGTNPGNPYISLDWACGSCHADRAEQVGFDFYEWASSRVAGIHGGGDDAAVQEFIGMDACVSCHEEYVQNVKATGHPYKVVSKADVLTDTAYPEYVQMTHGEEFAVDGDFFTDQGSLISVNADTFPNGGWDDVSYVIGGYGWKARFMGLDGYIITGSDKGNADASDDDKVQFNLPFDPGLTSNGAYPPLPATSAAYHTGELKPYTCGTCHTTGWVADVDPDTDGDLSDNQDGLPGIHGTWSETGVTCEGCHGPASLHAASPLEFPLPVQRASESCGNCHRRGDDLTDIDTSSGFVKHHEQYEEYTAATHFGKLECVTCHDPHRPIKYAEEFVAAEGTAHDPVPDYENRSGLRATCQDCHVDQTIGWASSMFKTMMESGGEVVDCVDCHMPRATKSAVKAGERSGDLRTHIFDIDTTVDVDADLTLHTAGDPSNDANRYISIDWACGGCHAEEFGTANDGMIYGWANMFDLTSIH